MLGLLLTIFSATCKRLQACDNRKITHAIRSSDHIDFAERRMANFLADRHL